MDPDGAVDAWILIISVLSAPKIPIRIYLPTANPAIDSTVNVPTAAADAADKDVEGLPRTSSSVF